MALTGFQLCTSYMMWSILWAKEGTRANMKVFVLQNRAYLQVTFTCDPRDRIGYWSLRPGCPFCYQANSESVSSSAALLWTAGSVCLSSGRKPGWRHWFLYPPAQMASGPKHFQTCIKRMWFKSGGKRSYRFESACSQGQTAHLPAEGVVTLSLLVFHIYPGKRGTEI